jgi:hypothetical protein
MRDLFFRQMRLSIDQVERLKKRVETNQAKLNSVRDTQKDGWGSEAEKLVQSIEADQAIITAQINRRAYIRAWWVAFPSPCNSIGLTVVNQYVARVASCVTQPGTHFAGSGYPGFRTR